MIDKRIVMVTNTLKEGGAAKIFCFVANTFAKCFREVIILTYTNSNSIYMLDPNIRVEGLNLSLEQDLKKNRFIFINDIWKRLKWMRCASLKIRSLNPDIIFSFVTDVIISTRISLLGYKAIFIASERGTPALYPIVWRILIRLIYPLHNGMIYQTREVMDYLNEHVGKRSCTIPNPCIIHKNVEPYYGERKKVIASVGRLVIEKNFESLIKAFAVIVKEYPEYRLVIYGEGYLRGTLEELIKSLSLGDKVELPGAIDNVPEKIRDCSVFVLSSIIEGIPNVLIEAMAVGLPVISTDCKSGGPASLINNGENGILIKVDDTDEMINAIRRILADNSLATRLGKEAIKISSQLNPDEIGEKWVEFIRECLNKDS